MDALRRHAVFTHELGGHALWAFREGIPITEVLIGDAVAHDPTMDGCVRIDYMAAVAALGHRAYPLADLKTTLAGYVAGADPGMPWPPTYGDVLRGANHRVGDVRRLAFLVSSFDITSDAYYRAALEVVAVMGTARYEAQQRSLYATLLAYDRIDADAVHAALTAACTLDT